MNRCKLQEVSMLNIPIGDWIDAINQLNCKSLSTGKPTHWPTGSNKISDLIDSFITRNVSLI